MKALFIGYIIHYTINRILVDCKSEGNVSEKKGKKVTFSFQPGFSAAGLIAFIVGALVACITGGTFASFPRLVQAVPFLNTPFFVGPVNGIVVSLVLYVILAAVLPKKKA